MLAGRGLKNKLAIVQYLLVLEPENDSFFRGKARLESSITARLALARPVLDGGACRAFRDRAEPFLCIVHQPTNPEQWVRRRGFCANSFTFGLKSPAVPRVASSFRAKFWRKQNSAEGRRSFLITL